MVAGLVIFMSCGGDDSNPFVNGIEMGDISIEDFGAYYDDYGTYCFTGPARTDGCANPHDGTGFMFTDGDYPEEAYWPENYSFTVYGTILTPSGEDLAGTYELMDWNTIYSEDRTGERVATFYVDFPEEFGGCCVSELEGTMTIKGSMPNLTITFETNVGYYQYNQEVRTGEGVNAYVDVSGKYKGEFLERVID